MSKVGTRVEYTRVDSSQAFSGARLFSDSHTTTELCKKHPCQSPVGCPSAVLRWTVEHFEVDSLNLAGLVLHNSESDTYTSLF